MSTLAEYSAALDAGDYDKAYEMMSERFRAHVGRDEFVRMMRANKREVRETARRLKGEVRAVEVVAEVRYGEGDVLRLVREGGRWRLATNPIAFYGQSTPREALRSFLRAYRLARWDVMLQFVPARYAERMDVDAVKRQFTGPRRDEIAAQMEQIAQAVDGEIVQKGEEARLVYGDGEVKFVREDGRWKILDID